MHPIADAQDALRRLSQACDRLNETIEVLECDESGWFIGWGGGEGFLVEWCTEPSRLVMSAPLGLPAPTRETATLNLALSYNALWRDIGDLRIARDGDEGELLLIGELGPEDCEPDSVAAALLHFDRLRRWWCEAIAGGMGTGVTSEPMDPFFLGDRL